MFRTGQKNADKDAKPEPFTYIHQDTLIEGNLNAKGRVRIYGVVRGNVTVEGVLEVAEYGVVEGELIKAHELRVLGRVKANVESNGKIEIWQKGELIGDIRATALDIEEGATFIGRSEMRPAGSPALYDVNVPINQALPEIKEDVN
jgi:cytoskeletal protein CcmA (bactofilin family)